MTAVPDNNKSKACEVECHIYSTRKRNRPKKRKNIHSKTTDKKQNRKPPYRICNYGSLILYSKLNVLSFSWHVVPFLQLLFSGYSHGLTSQVTELSLNTNKQSFSTPRLIFATKSVSFYKTDNSHEIQNTIQDHLINSAFEKSAKFDPSFVINTVDKVDASAFLERLINSKSQMSTADTKNVIYTKQTGHFSMEPRDSPIPESHTPVIISGPPFSPVISLEEIHPGLQVDSSSKAQDIPGTIQTISGKLSKPHSNSNSFVNTSPTMPANYQTLTPSINWGNGLSRTIREQLTSTFELNRRYNDWLEESMTDQSVIKESSSIVSLSESSDLSEKIIDFNSLYVDYDSPHSNIDNGLVSPSSTTTLFTESKQTNGLKYIKTSYDKLLITSTDVKLKPAATLAINEFLTGSHIFQRNDNSKSTISSVYLEVPGYASSSIIQSTLSQKSIGDSRQSQESNYRDMHQTQSFVETKSSLWLKRSEDLQPKANNSKWRVSSTKNSYPQNSSSEFSSFIPAPYITTVISAHKTLNFPVDMFSSPISTYRFSQVEQVGNSLIATSPTFTNFHYSFEAFGSVKHESHLETSFGFPEPYFEGLSLPYISTPSLPPYMDIISTEQAKVSSKSKNGNKSITVKSAETKLENDYKSNSISTSLLHVSSIKYSSFFSTYGKWNPLKKSQPTTQRFGSYNIASTPSFEKYVDDFSDIDNSLITDTSRTKILFTSDITSSKISATRIANTSTLHTSADVVMESAKESFTGSHSRNSFQLLNEDTNSYWILIHGNQMSSSPDSTESGLDTSFSPVIDFVDTVSMPFDLPKGTSSQDVTTSTPSLDFYKLSEYLVESKSTQINSDLSETVSHIQENVTVSKENGHIITQRELKTHSESNIHLNRDLSNIIHVATDFPFINDISVSDSSASVETESSYIDEQNLYSNSLSIAESVVINSITITNKDVLSKRIENNRMVEEGSQSYSSFKSNFRLPGITRSSFDYIGLSAKSFSPTQQSDQKSAIAGTIGISLMPSGSSQILESSFYEIRQTSTPPVGDTFNIHHSALNSEIMSDIEIFTTREYSHHESGSNFDGNSIGARIDGALESSEKYLSLSSVELLRLSYLDTLQDLVTSFAVQPSLSSFENRYFMDLVSVQGTYFESSNQLLTTSYINTERLFEDLSLLNVVNSFNKYSSVENTLTKYEFENETNKGLQQNISYFGYSISPFVTSMDSMHVTSYTMKIPSTSANGFQSSTKATIKPATAINDESISISMLSISSEMHGLGTNSVLTVKDESTQKSAIFSVSTEDRNLLFSSVDRNEEKMYKFDLNPFFSLSVIASPSSTRVSFTDDDLSHSNIGSLLTRSDFSPMDDETNMILTSTKRSYSNKSILPTKTYVKVSKNNIDTLIVQSIVLSSRDQLLSEADLSLSKQHKSSTESTKHAVSTSLMMSSLESSSTMSLYETSMFIFHSETYKPSSVQFWPSFGSMLQTMYLSWTSFENSVSLKNSLFSESSSLVSSLSDSFSKGYKRSAEHSLSPTQYGGTSKNNSVVESESSKIKLGTGFEYVVTSQMLTSEEPAERSLNDFESPKTYVIMSSGYTTVLDETSDTVETYYTVQTITASNSTSYFKNDYQIVESSHKKYENIDHFSLSNSSTRTEFSHNHNSSSIDFLHPSSAVDRSVELFSGAETSMSSIIPIPVSFDDPHYLTNTLQNPALQLTDTPLTTSVNMKESLSKPISWEPLSTWPSFDSPIASFEYITESSESILLKTSTISPNNILLGSTKTLRTSQHFQHFEKPSSKYSTLVTSVEPNLISESAHVDISFYGSNTVLGYSSESSTSITQYLQTLSNTFTPVRLQTDISGLKLPGTSIVVSNPIKDSLSRFNAVDLLMEDSASQMSITATADMNTAEIKFHQGLPPVSTIFKVSESNNGLDERAITDTISKKDHSCSLSPSPYESLESIVKEGTDISRNSYIYSEMKSPELITPSHSKTLHKDMEYQQPESSFEHIELSSSFSIPKSSSIASLKAKESFSDMSLTHVSILTSSLKVSNQVSVNLSNTSQKGLSETPNAFQSGAISFNFTNTWLTIDRLSEKRSIFISPTLTERETLAGNGDEISKKDTETVFSSDTRILFSLEPPGNENFYSHYQTNSRGIFSEELYPYTSPIFDSIKFITSSESTGLLGSSTVSMFPPVDDEISVNVTQSYQSKDKVSKAFITTAPSIEKVSMYNSVLRIDASATIEDRTTKLSKMASFLSESTSLQIYVSNSYAEISHKYIETFSTIPSHESGILTKTNGIIERSFSYQISFPSSSLSTKMESIDEPDTLSYVYSKLNEGLDIAIEIKPDVIIPSKSIDDSGFLTTSLYPSSNHEVLLTTNIPSFLTPFPIKRATSLDSIALSDTSFMRLDESPSVAFSGASPDFIPITEQFSNTYNTNFQKWTIWSPFVLSSSELDKTITELSEASAIKLSIMASEGNTIETNFMSDLDFSLRHSERNFSSISSIVSYAESTSGSEASDQIKTSIKQGSSKYDSNSVFLFAGPSSFGENKVSFDSVLSTLHSKLLERSDQTTSINSNDLLTTETLPRLISIKEKSSYLQTKTGDSMILSSSGIIPTASFFQNRVYESTSRMKTITRTFNETPYVILTPNESSISMSTTAFVTESSFTVSSDKSLFISDVIEKVSSNTSSIEKPTSTSSKVFDTKNIYPAKSLTTLQEGFSIKSSVITNSNSNIRERTLEYPSSFHLQVTSESPQKVVSSDKKDSIRPSFMTALGSQLFHPGVESTESTVSVTNIGLLNADTKTSFEQNTYLNFDLDSSSFVIKESMHSIILSVSYTLINTDTSKPKLDTLSKTIVEISTVVSSSKTVSMSLSKSNGIITKESFVNNPSRFSISPSSSQVESKGSLNKQLSMKTEKYFDTNIRQTSEENTVSSVHHNIFPASRTGASITSSKFDKKLLSKFASNPAILVTLEQPDSIRNSYDSLLKSSEETSHFHSLGITSSIKNIHQMKINTTDYLIHSASAEMIENSSGTTQLDSGSFYELSTTRIFSDSMPVTDNPFTLVSADQRYLSDQSFQEPPKWKDGLKTSIQVFSGNDPIRSSYSVLSEFLQEVPESNVHDQSGIFETESIVILPVMTTDSTRVSIYMTETGITPSTWLSLSTSDSPFKETFSQESTYISTTQEPFIVSSALALSSINNIQSRMSTTSVSDSKLSDMITPTPASLSETPISTYETAILGVSSSIYPTPTDQTILLVLALLMKPSVNISEPTLIQELENGLLECYEEGANKLKLSNLRKRRQSANVDGGDTNVKVTDMTRSVDKPSYVEVEFYVSENGDPTLSNDVEHTLNQLSLVELSAYLAYPVISRPRAVTKATKTDVGDEDTHVPLLVIIPIVILIVAIAVIVMVIYCCRKSVHSSRIKTRHSLVPSLTLKKPTLDEMDLMIDMEKGEVVSRRSNTSTLNVKAGGSNTNSLSTALQKLQETGAEKVSEMPLRLNTIQYFQRSFSEICSPQDRLERLKSLGLNLTEIHTRTLYQISEAHSNSENVAEVEAEQAKPGPCDKVSVNKEDATPYSSLKTDDPIFDLSSSESNQSQTDVQNLIQLDREEKLWNKVTFMANDGYLSDSSPRNKKASKTRENRLDTHRTQRQSVGTHDTKASTKDRVLKSRERHKRDNASRKLKDRDQQRSHPSVHGYSNKIFDKPVISTVPNHRPMGNYTNNETDTDSVCLPSSITDSDFYYCSDLDTDSGGRFEDFRGLRGDPYSRSCKFDQGLNGHDLPIEAVNDVMFSYLKPKEQLYTIDRNDLHTDGSEYAGYEFDSVNFSSNYKPAFTPPNYKYYSETRKHMEMAEPLVQYPEPSDPRVLEHVTKMGRVGSRGLPPPTYKPRFRPIPFQEQRKPPTPEPEPEPQPSKTPPSVIQPSLPSYEPYEEMKLGRNMRAVPRGGVRAVTSTNMQLDRDASEPLISANPPSNIVVDYLANTTSPLTAPSHHKIGRQTSHQPSPRSVVTPQHPSQDLIEMLNRNQSMNISRFEEQQRIIEGRKREADRKAQEQIREQERKEEEARKRAVEEIERLDQERQDEEWQKQAEIRRMREQREEEYRLEIERKNQEEMDRKNRETKEELLRQERIEAEKQHERDIQTKTELLRDSFALSPPPQTSKDLFTSNTTQQREKSTDQGSSLPFIPHAGSLNYGTETGGSTLTTKTDTYHGKTDDSKFDKQETVDEVQDIEEDFEVEQASDSDSDEFNHF